MIKQLLRTVFSVAILSQLPLPLLADHVVTGRTPETTARALFGRALESLRG